MRLETPSIAPYLPQAAIFAACVGGGAIASFATSGVGALLRAHPRERTSASLRPGLIGDRPVRLPHPRAAKARP